MAKRLIIFSGIILIALSLPFSASAYSEKTTHPALTEEIIEFYNYLYPERPIGPAEKELIIQGAVEEDMVPRPLNHLYDPVRGLAWNGEHIGKGVDPKTLAGFSRLFLVSDEPLTAVDWANNSLEQARYGLYGGDQSWPRGLKLWADGKKGEAYKVLGHILHLLEDMGVPDHTRNDAHPPIGSKLTGDLGSPYEQFAARYNRKNIEAEMKILARLKKSKARPPRFRYLQDYLKSMAVYSNNYFFSKDTIYDKNYSLPQIVKTDNKFGYGKDKNGEIFPLVRASIDFSSGIPKINFVLNDQEKDSQIFQSYFSRLSLKIALYGAGVIDLFHQQADDAIVQKEFPVRVIGYNPPGWFKVLGFNFSPAGEIAKLYRSAADVFAQAKDSASRLVSGVGRTFSDAFGLNDGFKLDSEIIVETKLPKSPKLYSGSQDDSSLGQTAAASPKPKRKSSSTKSSPVKFCRFKTSRQPLRNSLIINEVAWMGRPDGASQEWVELKNPLSQPLDISGFQLIDKSAQIEFSFPSNTVIPAGGFAVLARGSFLPLPETFTYTGALSNTKEGLRLFDPNCNLLDEVLADPAWPAGDNKTKQTMARTRSLSWQTSQTVGGTPGRENDFLAEPEPSQESNQPPKGKLVSASTTGDVSQLPSSQDKSSPPPKICKYQKDISSPQNRLLIINEVAWMGTAKSYADEWIELKNPLAQSLDAGGFQILSESGSLKIVLPASTTIPPGGLFLLERSDDDTLPDVAADLIYQGGLKNKSDGLEILDPNCRLVDGVSANPAWPAGDNKTKQTMERSSSLGWQTSQASGGTPKQPNSPGINLGGGGAPPPVTSGNSSPAQNFAGQVLISEIMPAGAESAKSEFVELYNPGSQAVSLAGFSLKKKTASGKTYNLVSKIQADIQPKSFLLIASPDYQGGVSADVLYSQASNYLAGKENSVLLTAPDGLIVDEASYSEIPAGSSLERKALSGQVCVSAQTDGEFLGNGCDTQSAADFELRDLPNPQNSASLPEPRPAPAAPAGFKVDFNSGQSEILFSWPVVSSVYSLTYRISEISPEPRTVAEGIAGLKYTLPTDAVPKTDSITFSLTAVDKDGLSSDPVSAVLPARQPPVVDQSHVVISEILFNAESSDGGKEFVELYNPTESAVDLNGFKLILDTEDASSTKTLAVIGSKDVDRTKINPKGFFLIGLSNFDSGNYGVPADLIRSAALPNSGNHSLALFDSTGAKIDAAVYSETLPAGQSWERKAYDGTNCLSASSPAAEFLGNGCDRNLAEDFSSRQSPTPQSTANFPEPRSAPAASEPPSLNYNRQTLSFEFAWPPYFDYRGSSSTVSYLIQEVTNSKPLAVYASTTPNFNWRIKEVGRDYKFKFQAFDKEGLGSEAVDFSYSVPSLISQLYFYQNPADSKAMADLRYDLYPFIPDLFRGSGNNTRKAALFYFNSEPAKTSPIYLRGGSSWDLGGNNLVQVSFRNCIGSTTAQPAVIFPDTGSWCQPAGIPNTQTVSLGEVAEDNRAVFPVAVPVGANLSPNDYLTAAFYGFSTSRADIFHFELVAVDKTKYHFSSSPPPSLPPVFQSSQLEFEFDDKNSKLIVKIPAYSDPDTPDSLLAVEVNFSPPGSKDDSLWRQVSPNEIYNKKIVRNVSFKDKFAVYLRAKDDLGNYSETLAGDWQYPAANIVYRQPVADSFSRLWGNKSNGLSIANSLVSPADFSFTKAALRLKQEPYGGQDRPSDFADLTLKVYPDKSNAPDSSQLLGSAVLRAVYNPDPDQDLVFNFGQPILFTASSTYWFVLQADYSNVSQSYWRNYWRTALNSANRKWYLILAE